MQCLSKMQQADGGFGDNSESIVQVLVGLCALDMDWNDARFVKNGNTLLDALLSYRQADGSFRHSKNGAGNSQMASEQGLYAKSSLYDMRSGDKQSNDKHSSTGKEDTVKNEIAVRELSAAEKEALQQGGAVLFRNLCGSPYLW